jgi:hypothetical protein
MASLQQQCQQTDTVNRQDEENRDLYAGTTFVLLFDTGTLGH